MSGVQHPRAMACGRCDECDGGDYQKCTRPIGGCRCSECVPTRAATAAQPAPSGDGVDVTESLVALPHVPTELAQDFARRSLQGRAKYGVTLRVWNGRDALVDAYQEALDLCVYLHQAFLESAQRSAEGPYEPYSRLDCIRMLRDDAIRVADTLRRRLL